jgi:hypothetical protein
VDYIAPIKHLFRPENIATKFNNLPPLSSPVMDLVFKERQQLPFAIVGSEDILASLDVLPMIRRGTPSLPMSSEGLKVSFYEPLPVSMNDSVDARTLNDLKQLDPKSLDTWLTNKLERLRQSYRKTTEAICSVALTGTVRWPVRLAPGHYEDYEVEFGNILTHAPATLWSAAGVKLADVFKCLKAMRRAIQSASNGGAKVEIWAGEEAFEALFAMAENHPERTSLPVEMSESAITVGGFVIKERFETYKHPDGKETVPVVPSNCVMMIATDVGHKLIYCAVDDIDARLQPYQFFVKSYDVKDPSSLIIVGQGKPFPVVNVKGICKAVVIG